MDRMVISQSKNKALVSVIIPVYNRKRKFLNALNSVLNQSYKNIEIIVIDDGSTDGLEMQINKYIQTCDNLIYLKQKNKGTPFALNIGIKISSGNYITFLDSDDLYEPNHIKKRVNIFEKNKRIDIIHTTAKIIGSESDMYVPDANNQGKMIHLSKCVIGATIFGKRNVFQKLKGFRNIYAYDYDFIKRAEKKFIVKKLNIPTYIYDRNSKDSVLTNLKKSLNFNI